MRQRELTVAIRSVLHGALRFVPGWTDREVRLVASYRLREDMAA